MPIVDIVVSTQDDDILSLEYLSSVQIRKLEPEWWPRLVATPQKPHWLKIDFDRWRTEDDAELEEKPRDVRQDYQQEYADLQKRELGYIKGMLSLCGLLEHHIL